MTKMKFVYRFSWTNWTFGLWWGKFGRTGRFLFGLDLGPWELIWRDMRPLRERGKK